MAKIKAFLGSILDIKDTNWNKQYKAPHMQEYQR